MIVSPRFLTGCIIPTTALIEIHVSKVYLLIAVRNSPTDGILRLRGSRGWNIALNRRDERGVDGSLLTTVNFTRSTREGGRENYLDLGK